MTRTRVKTPKRFWIEREADGDCGYIIKATPNAEWCTWECGSETDRLTRLRLPFSTGCWVTLVPVSKPRKIRA